MLLPVVFLLGIAAYARLVQINTEEFQLVLAMNRLRRTYLQIEPGLERYFSTGHHDDERGLVTTYLLDRPTRLWLWIHFLINTPTIVATVDAALAAAVVVLLLQLAEATRPAAVAGGAAAFLVVWGCCSFCSCTACASFAPPRPGSRRHRLRPDRERPGPVHALAMVEASRTPARGS